jgi:hypothetical protein
LRSRSVASADEVAAVIAERLVNPNGDLLPAHWFASENVVDTPKAESKPDESLPSNASSPSSAGRVITQHRNAPIAITTNNWFYVLSDDRSLPSESEEQCHLYLKPDDVDDFNNVVRLRLDEADQLHQTLLNEFHRAE